MRQSKAELHPSSQITNDGFMHSSDGGEIWGERQETLERKDLEVTEVAMTGEISPQNQRSLSRARHGGTQAAVEKVWPIDPTGEVHIYLLKLRRLRDVHQSASQFQGL